MRTHIKVFLILLLLGSLGLNATVIASDLAISREALEDPGGNLTLEQVEAAAFQPIGFTLMKGFTDSAVWIRLRVKPPATGDSVVLRIRVLSLDEIRLYEPDPAKPGHWNSRVTGDRYPYEQRDLPAIVFEFAIKPRAPDSTYYLRIKTSAAMVVIVEALEPRVADFENNLAGTIQLFYFAIMLFLLYWALYEYLNNRQKITALYIVYQAIYILYSIAVSGFFAVIAPADFPQLADGATSLLTFSVVFISLPFNRSLFRLFSPPPILMQLFNLLLLLFPLELGASVSTLKSGVTRTGTRCMRLIYMVFVFLRVSFTPEFNVDTRQCFGLHEFCATN